MFHLFLTSLKRNEIHTIIILKSRDLVTGRKTKQIQETVLIEHNISHMTGNPSASISKIQQNE
jgi:hypothetical protein